MNYKTTLVTLMVALLVSKNAMSMYSDPKKAVALTAAGAALSYFAVKQGYRWFQKRTINKDSFMLHKACQTGDIEQVKRALAADRTALNRYDEPTFGWTPLYWAVVRGHSAVVELLLHEGATKTLTYGDGRTALHEAVSQGRADIVQLLLTVGTDTFVNDKALTTNSRGKDVVAQKPCTKTHDSMEALDETVVDEPLRFVNFVAPDDADVVSDEVTPPSENTPAAHDNNTKATIRQHKRFVNMCDKEGTTALHHAAWGNNTYMVEMLLAHGAEINTCDNNKVTPLHRAASYGRDEIVAQLLDSGACMYARDIDGSTPLHTAAAHGHLTTITLLLNRGMDVNTQDIMGNTALYDAACTNSPEVIELLLQRGASPNIVNMMGNTPLHEAAAHNSVQAIDLLLEKGYAINQQNNYGATPLHQAITHEQTQAVQKLLEKGADSNARDNSGVTPLHLATRSTRPDLAALLLPHKAKLAAQDANGNTPLHLAAWYNFGRPELVKALVCISFRIIRAPGEPKNVNAPTDTHYQQRLDTIHNVLAIKNNRQATARDIAQARNSNVAKLLEHIETTKRFCDLDLELQEVLTAKDPIHKE